MADELPVAEGRGGPTIKNEYPYGGCQTHRVPMMRIDGIQQCPRCHQQSIDPRAPDQQGKHFVVATQGNTDAAFKLVPRKDKDGKEYFEKVYDKKLAKKAGLKGKIVALAKGEQLSSPVTSTPDTPLSLLEGKPLTQAQEEVNQIRVNAKAHATDLRSDVTLTISRRTARLLGELIAKKFKPKNLDDAEEMISLKNYLQNLTGGNV